MRWNYYSRRRPLRESRRMRPYRRLNEALTAEEVMTEFGVSRERHSYDIVDTNALRSFLSDLSKAGAETEGCQVADKWGTGSLYLIGNGGKPCISKDPGSGYALGEYYSYDDDDDYPIAGTMSKKRLIDDFFGGDAMDFEEFADEEGYEYHKVGIRELARMFNSMKR